MEHKTQKENTENPEQVSEDSYAARRSRLRVSFAILAAVVLIFALITAASELFGTFFGKSAEIGVLILAAGILAAMLIRDKRKK